MAVKAPPATAFIVEGTPALVAVPMWATNQGQHVGLVHRKILQQVSRRIVTGFPE
jgi:hypothetical protein